MDSSQDLQVMRSESCQNLEQIRRDDVIIGDLEELQLTSRNYVIKTRKTKNFWNETLIRIFFVIIIIYLAILYLYPFLTKIQNINVRLMTQQNGNLGLNQNYERVDPNDKNYVYIPIVGTDDIHGNFFPKVNNIKVGNMSLTYKTGGLEFVTKYINTLRDEFGANRVLYFDAGDFFQGGIASVIFDGEIMLDYFNLVGLNGSTIGNHEFDYSRDWIESKIHKAHYKVLINNIMDNSTFEKEGALGENHETSHIYEINLENGDTIKIGVIGLSFNMKNDKKMPNTWGNRDSWDNITFFNYIEELEKESYKLRQEGASAVLALTHFGLVCNQTLAMKLDMYNKTSVQGKCFREDDDSVLYKLLDVLKPGIIDGIIGGDTHMEMHHWENDIPMMSVPTHARYLNIMYLPFEKGEDGKYYLVEDEVKIEGPLPACERIFKNYQNCELISSKEYEQAGELINYSWHGIRIERDPMVQPIYDKYYQTYKELAEKKIVTFKGFDKIKVDKSGDCILCNTYLDAIKEIKEADFAIINRGIFPEELVPCTLTREDFYNQMPYLDKICTVNVTGEELKKIVGTVQTGKSFYPSSNLKQTIKIDSQGNKKVINIEIYVDDEPTPIEDDEIYIMASSMYVLSETSGEDFAKGESYKIIREKALNNEVKCSNKTIDEEIAGFFKGRGTIDLSDKVNPEKPRIVKIFE
jgi:2',3'-cyclic-nucleotide 2'-phosphodiesterase (5'-nucleotidase family)